MSDLRKAAEKILEMYLVGVDYDHDGSWNPEMQLEVINLRAALEAEHDEPVAWINRFENHDGLSYLQSEDTPVVQAGKYQCSVPLYTRPACKLTAADIRDILDKTTGHKCITGAISTYLDFDAFARAIEANDG